MTPSEIEAYSRRLLNATSSNFWSSEEIIQNHLYNAAMEMATECECIENRYTTVSVASQQEYSKPTRAAQVKRITYDGQKLQKIDFRQLDSIDYNPSSTTTGTPLYYAVFDETIFLHPVPDTSALTITIQTIDFPAQPTVNSTLEIPAQYHLKLAIGVAYLMSLKELGHPNVTRFQAMWAQALEDVKEAERKKKRGDGFRIVLSEEQTVVTEFGTI